MNEDRTITLTESAKLAELERTIEAGLATFVEVGQALMEIRDGRLYRSEHKTFEAYCRDKWNMGRTYAHRLMAAAETHETLPMGNKPATERQARPLTKLPSREHPRAWAQAVEIAGGKQPTAKQVEQAIRATAPRSKKKARGSYEDWRAFRETCEQIASLCRDLEALKVDAPHAIHARDLCAKLAKKLHNISSRQ